MSKDALLSLLKQETSLERRMLFAGLGASLLAARAEAATPAQTGATAPRKMFGAHYFGGLEVLTHEGERVRFYDDLLRGKLVLINAMYTTCEGICPTATATLKRVHTLLGDRVGRDVFFYSLTLRPKQDTPQALQQYVREHGIGAGWKFLTGTQRDVEALRIKLGFYDADPVVDRDRTSHTGIVRIGNDVYDRWAMAPTAADPEQILHTVRLLDRDRSAQQGGTKTA